MIDYNVFEGFEVTGLPRYTLSRGEVVFEDGTMKAEPGRGRFVERPPNQAVQPVAVVLEGADDAASRWSAQRQTCPRGCSSPHLLM